MKDPVPAAQLTPDAEPTGLPLLRSWLSVYLFVIATFALWVALLVALTRLFS